MSIILSLANGDGSVWAAGPEGLFEVTDAGLQPIPQPQQNLYCCCAIHDRIFTGGLPFGVAFSMQHGENWQAGWMDNVDAPVVTLAADPQVEHTGVILAGTDGGGILRTINRGSHWYTRNFGLHSFSVLAIVWAPPAPQSAWPRWQTVFACTEEGVYHSPNGGRGWKRSEVSQAVFQTIAVGPDFHQTGVVLAGTEGSGVFRSIDGGHSFEAVQGSPSQVNALAATRQGWLLSDENHIWHSSDGMDWTPARDTAPALVLLATDQAVWAGNEDGVERLALEGQVQLQA